MGYFEAAGFPCNHLVHFLLLRLAVSPAGRRLREFKLSVYSALGAVKRWVLCAGVINDTVDSF